MEKIIIKTYRNGRIDLPPVFETPSSLSYDWRKGDWELFTGKTKKQAKKKAVKKGLKEEHEKYGENASHYPKNPKSFVIQENGKQIEIKCPKCQ